MRAIALILLLTFAVGANAQTVYNWVWYKNYRKIGHRDPQFIAWLEGVTAAIVASAWVPNPRTNKTEVTLCFPYPGKVKADEILRLLDAKIGTVEDFRWSQAWSTGPQSLEYSVWHVAAETYGCK